MTLDERIALFGERWEKLGGQWMTVGGPEALCQALGHLCHEWLGDAKGPILYWGNGDLEGRPWHPTSPQWVGWDGTWDMRAVAAEAPLGVTGASFAVAETGSVAVASTERTGLLPSVLPPHHIMVVRDVDVVETVADGLDRWLAHPAPLMKMITGPSMTADIEGTLVVGVHGPGRVAAIIYHFDE